MPRDKRDEARKCVAALTGEMILRLEKFNLSLTEHVSKEVDCYENATPGIGYRLAVIRKNVSSIGHCRSCPVNIKSLMKEALQQTESANAKVWLFNEAQQDRLNARAEQIGLPIVKAKDGYLI